jgi:hypothetical protein
MPERSRFIRTFFPNERDRGVRLQASRDWFRFSGAVVNGNFIQDGQASNAYLNTDNNGWKDVIGRVGADLDWIVLGLSSSYGKAMNTTLGSGTTATTYMAWMRLRMGFDVQAYLDLLPFGGTSIKGEVAWQRDKNVDASSLANKCNDVSALGWYATGIQNIGDYLGVVFRVDQYLWNLADREGCMTSLTTRNPWQVPEGTKTTTYGGGVLIYGSANIKFSVIGEKVTGKRDLNVLTPAMGMTPATFYPRPGSDDDRITFQLQAKF